MTSASDRRRSAFPWWVPWAAMAIVVVVALLVGVSRHDGPENAQDRVTAISRKLKCPTCDGESVAESNSPAAKAMRIDVAKRIEQGQTDDEILAFYPTKYDNILVTPGSSGLIGLVWILPVIFMALAAAGLVLAFVRWRGQPTLHATEADRDLVAEALDPNDGDSARVGDDGAGS